jgi:hypothetical protein
MKCPRCGAASDVLETRPGEHLTTKRRRECFNGHRFLTLEVLPPATNRRDLAAAAQAAMAAARRWTRDLRVRKDPRPSTHVARELGITDARVRQIRAES